MRGQIFRTKKEMLRFVEYDAKEYAKGEKHYYRKEILNRIKKCPVCGVWFCDFSRATIRRTKCSHFKLGEKAIW